MTGGGVGGGTTGGGVGGGMTGGGVGGGTTGGGVGGGTTGGGVGGGTGGGMTGGGVGGGTGGCSAGTTLCNGRCVDVRVDAANCNLCGNACTAGQTCQLGTCTNASVNSVVFSEINPGNSTIELYNGGSAPVNLLGYTLQYSLGDGGSGSISLPSYTVNPQGFALLGQGSVDAGFVPMANVPIRSSDFALRLLNASASGVDFIRSGSSTVPAPTGTTWNGLNAPNPTVATSQSLVRNLFLPDSDSAADWTLAPNASPLRICARPSLCGTSCIDVENDRDNCGGCGNVCASSQVCRTGKCVAGGGTLLISEYRLDPVPMVELYNPGPSNVPLGGYRVQVAGTGMWLFTFPTGRVLAPGRFVVIYAGAGIDDNLTTYAGSAPPAGAFTDTSAVTLFDGTTGVDFVRFGTSSALPPSGLSWFGPGPTYPPMSQADLSVHRRLDSADSDDAFNFFTYTPSTTGFACQAGLSLCGGRCVNLSVNAANCGTCGNSCASPLACVNGACSGVGFVVISRLSNDTPERIELYNGTATSTSLDLHSVEWITESGTDNFSIPIGTTVASGGYLTLVEGTGTNTSNTIYMNKAIVWSTEIAVSLKSPSNLGIDFVRTGPSVSMPAPGTTWSGVNAANPVDQSTTVLERNVMLPDSNTAAEWTIQGQLFGSTCASSAGVCGAGCANLNTSSSNCGACGNVCSGGCTLGQCSKSAGGGGTLDNGRVRLTAGNGTNTGRLEVFNAGEWRQVCDDYFDLNNNGPTVVCRELGWSGMASQTDTTGPNSLFWLDDVQCAGTEASIFDCPHLTLGSHNCSSSEAISITCN
jgi:hypothetical protein